MLYSHRKAGQPGPLTRIMSCTPEEWDSLSDEAKTIMPTHVAPSYTHHPRTGDIYSAYNKPVAVIDWLARNDVKEEYVLIIDADMVMRMPFVPEEDGARPGRAVSAHFSYMKGVNNELAMKHIPDILPRNDTLAGPSGRRSDQVGGFTMMYTKDLKRVAPLWLKYTEDVRFDPDAWTLSGDAYSTHPGDKPWISEMYGYSYACARADVWHVCHRSAMMYPGYETSEPPKVLHYGLFWEVEGSTYKFDKHWHYDFDPFECPPWDLSSNDSKDRKEGLFPHPPRPSLFKTTGSALLRDLLAVQVPITLNAAFCERHRARCAPSEQLEKECAIADQYERELDAMLARIEGNLPDPCSDQNPQCGVWAKAGECETNGGYMLSTCALACNACQPRTSKKTSSSPPPPLVKRSPVSSSHSTTTGAAAAGARGRVGVGGGGGGGNEAIELKQQQHVTTTTTTPSHQQRHSSSPVALRRRSPSPPLAAVTAVHQQHHHVPTTTTTTTTATTTTTPTTTATTTQHGGVITGGRKGGAFIQHPQQQQHSTSGGSSSNSSSPPTSPPQHHSPHPRIQHEDTAEEGNVKNSGGTDEKKSSTGGGTGSSVKGGAHIIEKVQIEDGDFENLKVRGLGEMDKGESGGGGGGALMIPELKLRCTRFPQWSITQVRRCMAMAEAGAGYDPDADDGTMRDSLLEDVEAEAHLFLDKTNDVGRRLGEEFAKIHLSEMREAGRVRMHNTAEAAKSMTPAQWSAWGGVGMVVLAFLWWYLRQRRYGKYGKYYFTNGRVQARED